MLSWGWTGADQRESAASVVAILLVTLALAGLPYGDSSAPTLLAALLEHSAYTEHRAPRNDRAEQC